MIRYLHNPSPADCFVFGSSRAELLSADSLKFGRCHNFSVSDGTVREFLAYSRYLESVGHSPSSVLIGVDLENVFYEKLSQLRLPGFIERKTAPPPRIVSYLDLRVLRCSLEFILRKPRLGQHSYNLDYSRDIYRNRSTRLRFDPNRWTQKANLSHTYRPEALSHYYNLATMFPEAQVVFYVPPIGGWRAFQLDETGKLKQYIHALSILGSWGIAVYDFSIPHRFTFDYSATIDGTHYTAEFNDRVAERLNGERSDFGLRVDGLTQHELQAAYAKAMDEWRHVYDKNHR